MFIAHDVNDVSANNGVLKCPVNVDVDIGDDALMTVMATNDFDTFCAQNFQFQ